MSKLNRFAWVMVVVGWSMALYGIYLAHTAKDAPTDTQVEFYYAPEPSEWHNEDAHPICCANETEECRKCVTL